jgi:predicted RNA-binding protein with PUA-like domain
MSYWLFQSNPKYYRIFDALKEREELPWLVTRHSKEIQIGDGVLVWIGGKDAGIYAIAQVIESPQVLETIADRDYWLDREKIAPEKLRVRISFIRKLIGQPLRKIELKQDRLLKNLLVMRVPHGTNFRVTNEEWQRIYQLKG